MKSLPVILVLAAAAMPAPGQVITTNNAAIAGWCRSLALEVGSGAAPGGPAQIGFSTYDGVPNRLLADAVGGVSIVSAELRPRTGAFGVYETDYGLFRAGQFFELGTMALTFPTLDADTNGVLDVTQVNQSGQGMVGGGGMQESPLASPFMVSGQLTRNAGADLGTYALAWATNNGAYALSGPLRVLHFEGQAAYTRAQSNVLRLQLTLANQNGTPLVLTGSTVYTIRSAGEVLLPLFRLRNGARQYTAQPMTLARAGQRYAGNLRFNDGNLDTSWADYVNWAVELTDTNDANTNGVPDFSDPLAGPDFAAPRVSISFPAAGARITNATAIVQGTASDDRALAAVLYSLNGAPFTNASGSNIWTAPVMLVPGTNVFAVKAVDAATNTSPVVTRRFIHVVTSRLTNEIVGLGRIMPDLNGQLLEVGRRYTVTAIPAVSNLFAFWSGGTSSPLAKLTFTMTSNLVLTANFVPNPFLPITGGYTGLFAEPSNIVHETSGYFSAQLTGRGGFSATLRRAGRTHAFAGQFALDGKATNRIRLNPTNQLVVMLCLDLTNGLEQMTGSLDESGRIAVLTANRTQPRSPANPAGAFAGKYTMSLPTQIGGTGPAGASLASVTADTNGNARLSGFLADGTPFTAAGAVSKDGAFPVYQGLYAGRGSIWCALRLTNAIDAELAGEANWIKPARPLDRLYPEGFNDALSVQGARYVLGNVTNALAGSTNRTVEITGLPTPDTAQVLTWNGGTRLTNSTGLSLTLTPATGLWTGVYPEPIRRQRLPLRTTLQPLPDGYVGLGFVIQSNLSGRVTLNVMPEPQ